MSAPEEPLEPLEAALRVLREEGAPLHWTVILDRAQRRGYLDPFTQPDLRRRILAELADAARAGDVEKHEKGVYALPHPHPRLGLDENDG